MNKKYLIISLFILIVILIISNFTTIKNLDYVKNENIILEEKLNVTEKENEERRLIIDELTEENIDISKSKVEVEESYEELESTYGELNDKFKTLKQETKSTISEIAAFQKEIKESMDWFRYNSVFDDDAYLVKNYIKDQCYKVEGDTCRIKLSCFYLVNSEKLDYHYKYDIQTSEEVDQLQPLTQFIENEGGDCEDYSLFFKAEYNYLIDECLDDNGKDIELEAWESGGTNNYWMHFGKTWYMENVKGKIIDKNFIYPVVVCGNMYDPNTDKVNGHCALGFTETPIENPEDLKELTNVPLIEPQNGMWMGYVDLSNGNPMYQLVTDNDMFLYREGEWKSYGSFFDELEAHRMGLVELR